MGLNVALVHRRCVEITLHDDIGLGKALIDVAKAVLHMLRDVGVSFDGFAELVCPEVVVEYWRAILHGILSRHDGGQHLVLHLYQAYGLLGDVDVERSNTSHRMPLKAHPVGGHYALTHCLDCVITL